MPDSAKDHVLKEVKEQAIYESDVSHKEFVEHEEKLYSLANNGHLDQLLSELERLKNEEGWKLEEQIEYLEKIIDPEEIERVDKGKVEGKMPRKEKLLLQDNLISSEGTEFLGKTDKTVGIEHIFNVHEAFYRNTGNTAFIISNQQEWEGRISVELSDTKKQYELMSVYENKEENLFFKHFGQNNPNKGYNQVDDITKSFYEYKFVADDKEYLALSTEKLDTVRCKLRGMKVSIDDYKTVGEFSKLAVNRDIIFVHSVEPAIKTMEENQLETYVEDVDHEFLAEKMLGGWRQPEWFEKFMFANLAVNNENGYPSHMIWLSGPGTGKSKALESLLKSMREKQKQPFTGSGSTVKGLVPSFKESPPDEGYLLKTQRLAGVDEKMDLLSNSIQQGNASNDVFRPLLNLLTHDTRTFESGNGSIKGQMMSTMWATGNFNAYGIRDMKELAEKIDSAYLSRCIIYSQTDSHINFINDRKSKVKQKMQEENLDENDLFPEPDDEFISFMDTLREEKRARIDFMKVNRIHKELMEIVPGYMRDIFNQRGAHHMENILLGLVKYRCVVEADDDYEATDQDYEELKKIFELIISGWDDVEVSKLSFEAKKEALTPPQRRVFNVINDNPGVDGPQLDEKVEVDSLSWCLTELKKYELIAVENESKYYPYWSEEYREIKDVDEDEELY